MFNRKPKRLTLVVATRDRRALEALHQIDLPLERREALTTNGLYQALPGAHLAIVDLAEVAESPTMSRERLAQVLANTLAVSGAVFAAQPAHYLDQARAASSLAGALPARCVALAGLSGGVGKTTLALSLAKFFRKTTGLPAAVIELSTGPSGLLALLAPDDQTWPHLYEAVSQGKPWPTWEGVTLAGMAWDTARLLTDERVQAAWQALASQHVLTVIDAPAYHPHWPLAAVLADRIWLVADGRPDALANAVWLLEREPRKAELLLNRGGLAAQIALPVKPLADLPEVGRAAQAFPSKLGQRLMTLAYPGWKS
jgi:hypothetical protein